MGPIVCAFWGRFSLRRRPGARLDGAGIVHYPANPMRARFRSFLLVAAICVALPERSPAPVIFRPNEKVKYQAPGEEEINGNAIELFEIAQTAERNGNQKRAIKAYLKLVKRYPRSIMAADSLFRAAQLAEGNRDLLKAAGYYRQLMENYPKTPHFEAAIESQFRIGELYLHGKKVKLLGVPVVASMDDAVEIFAAIVRSAPYGNYTARAQFDIGRAREKQGASDLAIAAYEAVVEKFPNDPLAIDAQYQIGYIWLTATKAGTNDPNAIDQARTAFQDFLFRFPKSEKAPQARENLVLLDRRQIKSALDVAKYYDKEKNYRAAVIYYNEVIRQQPGSTESGQAQKRIDQLRAKVGDAALQSAATLAEKNAQGKPGKKPVAQTSTPAPAPGEQREAAKPQMRGNPSELAPLPATDADSLPPAASGDSSPLPEPAAAPEASATPESSATPTPEASATP
jgi:outer membrane protein assembly factor BamD